MKKKTKKKVIKQTKLLPTELFEQQMEAAGIPSYVKEHKFLAKRRFRFDFAWVDLKLAFELEGGVWTRGRHTSPIGYTRDCEKYNLAAIDGWTVLRATSGQVSEGKAIEWLIMYLNTKGFNL